MSSRLGVRSAYSFLYGVHGPEALAERARSYGAATLGITDRNGLFGMHAAFEACRDRGLKCVVGAELVSDRGSVFAFVLNREGYGRLCELLSSLNAGPGGKTEAIFSWPALEAMLRENAQGLALAAFLPGLLEAMARRVPRLYGAVSPRDLQAVPVSGRLGVPLLALEDAVFLDPGDEKVHAVLRAIALGKTLGALDAGDCADGGAYLLASQKRDAALASWPEAVAAAEALAEESRFEGVSDGYVFPSYAGGLPDRDAEARLLRRRVYAGAETRYGELSDAVVGRIEYELDTIGRKGFASYFLLMDDIVSMCPRTCGRGSAAASIVAYALSITNVDPIKENLYFERFLNIARSDPPDIDVDFPWDERDDLIRRVIERFGPDRCARVANHNRFKFRSAFRECAKVYGFAEGEISRMERSLTERGAQPVQSDPVWQTIMETANRLEGLPRGLSMHCGGLVITPGPIRRYAPILRSAQGYPLLAWEKEGTESAGLVKLDLLGNRSLAVIRDALSRLAAEGLVVDFDRIRPAEDAAVQDALARGDSLGVFYIESPAMRQLQRKTGRGDFAHIVIHSSLIRPAANRFISEYVRRLKGGAWEPLHPRLAYILDESYGILCYQEDVSKTAVALASFSEADADALRKVIAKKAGGKKLESFKDQFYAGCAANGVALSVVEEIWAMMLSFDGYSFCKPHSASYAMVSFQSAYLRVHHGAHFMAAVLSNQGGYYSAQAYVGEAVRMGLAVAGPDINLSEYRYRGADRTVIVGFMAVAGLSRDGADSLVNERSLHGAYASLEDVCNRIRLRKDDVVTLAAAGVFDSLASELSRPDQVRRLLTAVEERRSDFFPAFQAAEPRIPWGSTSQADNGGLPALNDHHALKAEFASLGFLRDKHPLFLWRKELSAYPLRKACELPACVGTRVALAGWQITRKEVWTKDGLAMNFISFEDETALYETVLFPEVYEAYSSLLFDARPFIVAGKVMDDQGALCVEVSSLRQI